MSKTAWLAPAKLNLCLRVIGRRDDGYHDLQTAFQFIDLHDTLSIDVRHDGEIRRRGQLTGVDEDGDLTVRAARLLRARSGCSLGADIRITKAIPMGAGLGGGSSDAATTLIALNELWELGWDRDALAAIGVKLGADVPVFVKGQAAWGEGIGERLTPAHFPETDFVVLVPPVHVTTACVFAALDLTHFRPPIKIPDPRPEAVGNDLESAAIARYPAVAEGLGILKRFGTARMSGSGGSVFVPLANAAEAAKITQRLADEIPPAWECYAVRGLNVHPHAPQLTLT